MAYWIVRQEIDNIDVDAYRESARLLRVRLESEMGPLYRTTCLECGSTEAHVKYFIWVKTHQCVSCREPFDLFPGYMLAKIAAIRLMSLFARLAAS